MHLLLATTRIQSNNSQETYQQTSKHLNWHCTRGRRGWPLTLKIHCQSSGCRCLVSVWRFSLRVWSCEMYSAVKGVPGGTHSETNTPHVQEPVLVEDHTMHVRMCVCLCPQQQTHHRHPRPYTVIQLHLHTSPLTQTQLTHTLTVGVVCTHRPHPLVSQPHTTHAPHPC